jgi:hypothetical protein
LSSRFARLRVPVAFGIALAASALAGAIDCGTEPCFRHSDCASTEICSEGACVLAPVYVSIDPSDSGLTDASIDKITPAETSTPLAPEAAPDAKATPDADSASMTSPGPEASADGPADATDAADAADAVDAAGDRTGDAAPE